MDGLISAIKSWNSEDHISVSEDDKDRLKDLLVNLKLYQESRDLSLLERLTLLIDECIILDMVNDDMVEHQGEDFSRADIIAQIEKLFSDLLSSSMISELNENPVIAAKENLAYRIAILLQKIHRYQDAFNYFQKSRQFSNLLPALDGEHGLSEKERIERDIHFAFCCEYIGTPYNDKNNLIIALKVLIGDREGGIGDGYWGCLKEYFSSKWDNLERIILSDGTEADKGDRLISLFLGFSSSQGVLHRVYEKKNEFPVQYQETLHVLSHCLNEMNLLSPSGIVTTKAEETEELKKTRIIKMISCFLMDSLGPEYATCQATIRAEQGNGIDAISKMKNIDTNIVSRVTQAELDFYLFYFESLFSHTIHTRGSGESVSHGSLFRNYCEELIKNDPKSASEGKDGILHYSVFTLRNELKKLLIDIKNSDDINKAFLSDEYRIEKTQCFEYYSEIREKEFSIYVNSQMVSEKKKLISIYNIIKIMQSLKFPLVFDQGGDFEEQIHVDSKVEELFVLCRQFNSYPDTNIRKLRKESTNLDDASTFIIDGLMFDIHGDTEILTGYLESKMIEKSQYSIEKGTLYKKDPTFPRYKMIIYPEGESDKTSKCIQGVYDEMCDGLQYQVYYIGEPDYDNFAGTPINALKNIELCFALAYIYATVERVIAQVLNPKPIYILAPLRNSTTYSFQEADAHTLLISPAIIKRNAIGITRGGIGIGYKLGRSTITDCTYDVQFYDEHVKNACIEIIRFEDDKLYVLRENKTQLVRKTVHTEFVKDLFHEYANSRKRVQNRRHEVEVCEKIAREECKTTKCNYFFAKIDNSIGAATLSIKDHYAGTKLIQFTRLACEEDAVRGSNLYLFDKSYAVDNNTTCFLICIFNENLPEHYKDICIGDLVTITKVANAQTTHESTTANQELDEAPDHNNDSKLRDELIGIIEGKIKQLTKNKYEAVFDKTKSKIEDLKKQYQDLLNECKNSEKDTSELQKALEKINKDLQDARVTE